MKIITKFTPLLFVPFLLVGCGTNGMQSFMPNFMNYNNPQTKPTYAVTRSSNTYNRNMMPTSRSAVVKQPSTAASMSTTTTSGGVKTMSTTGTSTTKKVPVQAPSAVSSIIPRVGQ